MKRPSHPRAPQENPELLIVVIEDDPDLREPLSELLASWGHRVDSAATGEAGLLLLARAAPDVALIDIGLPDMSGYDVADRIRALGETRPHLIALTGFAAADDDARAIAAGFDRHLSKPPDLTSLRTVLTQLARDLGRG